MIVQRYKKLLFICLAVLLATLDAASAFAAAKIASAKNFNLRVSVNGQLFSIDSDNAGAPRNAAQILKSIWTGAPLYSAKALKQTIASIATKTDVPPKNYSISAANGNVYVDTATAPGKILNQQTAFLKITAAIENHEKKMALDSTVLEPQVSITNAQKAAAQANLLLEKDLWISYNGHVMQVPRQTIAGWIGSVPSGADDLEIYLDKNKVAQTLRSLTEQYDSAPKEMVLDLNSQNKNSNFIPPVTGTQANTSLGSDQIINLYSEALARKTSDSGNKNSPLNIELITIQPPVPDSAAKLGIVSEIGTGATTFYDSSNARIHNIKIGANALNNILIGPDKNFQL